MSESNDTAEMFSPPTMELVTLQRNIKAAKQMQFEAFTFDDF